MQAAISSFEVPLIGSNVVRLVVRSKPQLQNPLTKLTVAAVRETAPGQELQVKAQVHNSGQSSAHDLIVLLPVPANTTYVADSARVSGHAAGGSERDPFGFGRPAITVKTLGPGTTIDVGYRVLIDPVIEDATAIAVSGAVCSQEVAEFALAPVTLKVASAPSFAGAETEFRADCEDDVEPGQRIALGLRARNTGTAIARAVRLKIDLPDGLAYTPGSRSIDGVPAVDRARGQRHVRDRRPRAGPLRRRRARRGRRRAASRRPRAPARRERWSGRRASAASTAPSPCIPRRSSPPRSTTSCARARAASVPGDPVVATVHLANLGADVATDVRLLLEGDEGLEGLRALEGKNELPVRDDGAVQLDTLEPGKPRTVRVEARVAPVIEDETQLRLRATLRTAQLDPIELGAATHVVASRPKFSAATSKLALAGNEVLRPNRTTLCRLSLANEGTDAGRDVRVRLQLPEELRLEGVEGASRDGQSIVFGAVPAGETRDATVHLRLVATISHGDVLEVGARVSGLNVVPFTLETMRVATHAEPAFADNATLVSTPDDAIDARRRADVHAVAAQLRRRRGEAPHRAARTAGEDGVRARHDDGQRRAAARFRRHVAAAHAQRLDAGRRRPGRRGDRAPARHRQHAAARRHDDRRARARELGRRARAHRERGAGARALGGGVRGERSGAAVLRARRRRGAGTAARAAPAAARGPHDAVAAGGAGARRAGGGGAREHLRGTR